MAKEPRVLTFEEAQKCGVLQSFVDKRLEEAYPQVRKKNSQHYLRKDGAWKPLASVKDEVGLAVSTDLLHEIQKVYTQYTGKEPSEEQRTSPLFYVQYRMLIAMQEERERQGKQEDISALAAQWNFIKEEKSILKSDQEFFPTTESLALAEGDYSIPSLDQKGFFRMGTKEKALEVTPEEYKRVRALLLQETQKKMMTHLLEIMQEAGGIIL
ncbi:MAG: hypothetical protein FJZ58_04175 [Chlamydiae bacterium]|nr:hypothetical protein [Chlamydiota bacterium]